MTVKTSELLKTEVLLRTLENNCDTKTAGNEKYNFDLKKKSKTGELQISQF